MADKNFKIGLKLWGEKLNPQLVTSLLGIHPHTSYEKGYVKQLSSGKAAAPKELGIWTWEQPITGSIEEGVSTFLKRFEGKNIKHIQGVEIVIVDLYLGLSNENAIFSESIEYRLNCSLLKTLEGMGADLRITIT